MSEFKEFNKLMQGQFLELIKLAKARSLPLYKVDINPDELYDVYLSSFPVGSNEIFRTKSIHDCRCCYRFLRDYGTIVALDSNHELVSLWDFYPDTDAPYNEVAKALSEMVHKVKVVSDYKLFITKKLGIETSLDAHDTSIVWSHLYYELPHASHDDLQLSVVHEDKIPSLMSQYESKKIVLTNGLNKISIDALETVKDLILQNSINRGEQWLNQVEGFIKLKSEYDKLSPEVAGNFISEAVFLVNPVIVGLKNTSLGTLLVDLSEGVDINTAMTSYERITEGENYKRPKEIFTRKQVEESEAKIIELGYENSLQRRFANLEDITVNNLLYVDRNVRRILEKSVFDKLKDETITESKFNLDRVEEISIEDFIKNVIPTANSMELYLSNENVPNLVSLISPMNKTAPSMFQWDNNFSWSYKGNITDSSIKQSVELRGGKTSSPIRCSLDWSGISNHDLDLHCKLPNGKVVSFRNMDEPNYKCKLDVDIRVPWDYGNKSIVENIVIDNPMDGNYLFLVDLYDRRELYANVDGFSIELVLFDQIYQLSYTGKLDKTTYVTTFEVKNNKVVDGSLRIDPKMDHENSSIDIWNVKTKNFIKVHAMMLSPNYWDNNTAGNKHYMFILQDCKNPDQARGFYNEFLKHDLVNHKRVFEALGSRMLVENSDNQLSGVGFSSTKRSEVIVKVSSTVTRLLKIKF